MGDSVGRWEGDTLVVDTIGYNEKTEVSGYHHSDALHTVERFKRTDDGFEYDGRVSHFARSIAAFSTDTPRSNGRCFIRNSIASIPAAAASSSMKHSATKILSGDPTPRMEPTRIRSGP